MRDMIPNSVADLKRHMQATAVLPPPRLGSGVDIFSGVKGVPKVVCVLSTVYSAYWVHWVGNRSLPCLDKQGKCPADLHSFPLVWHAYASCQLEAGGPPWLLSLTYEGVRNCPELVAEHSMEALRGQLLNVSRGKPRRPKQQVVEWLSRKANWELPPSLDIDSALWVLWGRHNLIVQAIAGGLNRPEDWIRERSDRR